MSEIRWSDQIEAADWISQLLYPGLPLPASYPAYARILHPVEGGNPQRSVRARWTEIAAWSGVALEPSTDFWQIALPERLPEEPIPGGGDPASDVLGAEDSAALIRVLREHTTNPERCWFGIWEGYGWDDTAVPAEVRYGPRIRLPHRDYLLYTGPVAAGVFLPSVRESADLWWPEDRAWFVYGDVDLSWTYVGGSDALARELVASTELEALRVDSSDPAVLNREIPAWLASRIDTAVEALMTTGSARLPTSRFILQLDFGTPDDVTALNTGARGLRFSQDGPLSMKGGWSVLSRTSDLRSQVRQQIISWVIDMVQG